MSKIVKVEKNLGDFLTRYDDNKYVAMKNDDDDFQNILIANECDDFFSRQSAIRVEDMDSINSVFPNFSVELLPAADVPSHDPYHEEMAENQNMSSILNAGDGIYRVMSNSQEMNSFPSSVPSQGTHQWLAIAIHTGEPSILGIKWNGYSLTSEDIAEAQSVNLGNGDIIFWFKYDAGNNVIIMEKGGRSATLTFLVD